MDEEKKTTPAEQPQPPATLSDARKAALLRYMAILFAVAFLEGGLINIFAFHAVEKGYLVTEQSSDDRRFVAVRLTEAAEPVIQKLKEAEDEYFSGFMGALPSSEEASLVTRIFDAAQKFSPAAFLGKLSGKNRGKDAGDKD